MTCFSCGNKGHYSTECPSKTIEKKDEDSGKKQNRKRNAKRVQVVEQTILQQEDDSDDLNIMIGRGPLTKLIHLYWILVQGLQ